MRRDTRKCEKDGRLTAAVFFLPIIRFGSPF